MGSYAIAKENSLDYSIVSLLGVQDYKVNQKFIQKLFENQEEFLNGVGEPDLYKISKILKENGLLKLTFGKPMELEIAFEIKENPATFTSVLYDVLGAMGYYYFLVKQSMLEDEKYHFVLSMNTEYAVDPVLLQERLLAYGYHISKIEKRNINQWVYEVWQGDFQYPKAILLTINETNNHANLKGEYWYKIQEGKNISFASVGGVSWYPKIVFFDKNLKIINIVSLQDTMREINLKIPENTSFIKVSDNYLPITIKNGLNVFLK